MAAAVRQPSSLLRFIIYNYSMNRANPKNGPGPKNAPGSRAEKLRRKITQKNYVGKLRRAEAVERRPSMADKSGAGTIKQSGDRGGPHWRAAIAGGTLAECAGLGALWVNRLHEPVPANRKQAILLPRARRYPANRDALHPGPEGSNRHNTRRRRRRTGPATGGGSGYAPIGCRERGP